MAPSILGLIERGVGRDPALAGQMRGRVVFRFAEDFSPLRITFRPKSVVVEDGDLRKPDLVIAGRLPDIVHFATVPILGGRFHGVPDPRRPRGARGLGPAREQAVRRRGRPHPRAPPDSAARGLAGEARLARESAARAARAVG